MKALVGAFNQEKALVGAFSVIVQLHRLIDLRHYSLTKQRTTTDCPPAGVDAVAVRGGPDDVRRGHRELAEVLQQFMLDT